MSAESGVMLEVSVRSKDHINTEGIRAPVLRDVEFSIEHGQFVCVIGPSGCGKTTLLRLILGLDRDFDGTIRCAVGSGRVRAVFQEPRLLPWRTVEQNVALTIAHSGGSANQADLEQLYDELELSGHRQHYPAELSLGLARRVALARAFACRPGLLLLDEPFVSLDEFTAVRLREQLAKLCREYSITALMVTHNVREAAELADVVLMMDAQPGKVSARFAWPQQPTPRAVSQIDQLAFDLARASGL